MRYQLLPAGKRTQTGVYASIKAEDGTVIGPLWVPKEKIGPGGISCELKTEKSCGAVIFREKGKERRYLLLCYKPKNSSKVAWWDFVKGHIENGETERETVVREIKEETGILESNLTFLPDIRTESAYYHFVNGTLIHKTISYLAAKTDTEKITIRAHEHLDYDWLPYEEALKKITYENSKRVLKKAEDSLNSKVAPADSSSAKNGWRF